MFFRARQETACILSSLFVLLSEINFYHILRAYLNETKQKKVKNYVRFAPFQLSLTEGPELARYAHSNSVAFRAFAPYYFLNALSLKLRVPMRCGRFFSEAERKRGECIDFRFFILLFSLPFQVFPGFRTSVFNSDRIKRRFYAALFFVSRYGKLYSQLANIKTQPANIYSQVENIYSQAKNTLFPVRKYFPDVHAKRKKRYTAGLSLPPGFDIRNGEPEQSPLPLFGLHADFAA